DGVAGQQAAGVVEDGVEVERAPEDRHVLKQPEADVEQQRRCEDGEADFEFVAHSYWFGSGTGRCCRCGQPPTFTFRAGVPGVRARPEAPPEAPIWYSLART